VRQHVRDKESLAELTASADPEMLGVVPVTRGERPANGRLWLALRAVGALSLLATGAVHLHLFDGLYSAIPTIGTLFILNFAGATALALALLAPLERIGGTRYGGPLLLLVALAGVALAATSFVFLLISEQTPLFGFKEPGYDPTAISVSRIAEIATVVSLVLFVAGRFWLRVPMRRW